ncbi:hypothetical protein M514_11392, partial [Trichuris suis]
DAIFLPGRRQHGLRKRLRSPSVVRTAARQPGTDVRSYVQGSEGDMASANGVSCPDPLSANQAL